jgi:hypothetical protein
MQVATATGVKNPENASHGYASITLWILVAAAT